ncbi:MAG: CobW family GTP-binding protein [Treponema sp.]
MKILIISGFLGAGKTTFIGTLSQKTQGDFAVMENEYGQAGIDGELLSQNRLKVWELTEGCICCSLKSDFASSILTIANTLNPEYLIVEPTGVGLLSAVIRNIAKIEYERIRLLSPVTVVDVFGAASNARDFREIYADQITHAGHIVLSKMENASAHEIEAAKEIIRSVCPAAKIADSPYQALPSEWWERLLSTPLNTSPNADALDGIQPPDLESVGISGIRFDSIDALLTCLSALMRGQFGNAYRVKGFAPINGRWAKFDVVGTQYSIAECAPMTTPKAVVIGSSLDKGALTMLFGGKEIVPAAGERPAAENGV